MPRETSRDIIVVPQNATGTLLLDEIAIGGKIYDLTGGNAWFSMREVNDTTLKVNKVAASLIDAPNSGVAYTWHTGDLDTAGEYRGWWTIQENGGVEIETDEFALIVDSHSPGVGVRMGMIANRMTRIIPKTFAGLSADPDYGDRFIQDAIEQVKAEVLLSPPDAANESSLNTLVQDYLAKMAVIELYPAAVDYWSNQRVSIASREERAQYPDRLAALDRIHRQLTVQIAAQRSRILAILEGSLNPALSTRSNNSAPLVDTEGITMRTPDPNGFPREYSKRFKGYS